MADDQVTVTARCLCKTHVYETTVPRSSLPLLGDACHCNSCRHARGSMYLVTTKWPNPKQELAALHKYAFGPNLDEYSCATCGTPMFCLGTKPGAEPSVILGCLDNTPGLVKYDRHIFVGDTKDGGATAWLRENPLDGGVCKRFRGWDEEARGPVEELPQEWPAPSGSTATAHADPVAGQKLASPERTPVWCHCRGVDLVLRSAVDMAARPTEELPLWVEPTTCKYLASTECCDSCRLAFGCDLVNWTFPPLSHIAFADGGAGAFPKTVSELKERVDAKDPRMGTLKYYQSSPDVERYFCSRCAASVFYTVHDRPDMVDLAVGLLEHPDGARAEGLLAWNFGEVFWQADVAGGWREGFAKKVEAESEEWRIKGGIPKGWRRVIREENRRKAEEAKQQ